MQTFGVIKSGDVIKDHGDGGGAGGRDVNAEGLGFERGPKRFHGGVVIAVAFAAHAGDGVAQAQIFAVRLAGILTAAIGVNDEAVQGNTTIAISLAQRVDDQPCGHRGGSVPAEHSAAA